MTISPVKEHVKLSYRMKKIVVDRSNVEFFERLKHARPINPAVAGRLHGVLLRGEHFESTLVVNDVSKDGGSHFRLIDGGHRLEAVKRFVRNEGMSVEVAFAIYEHLSPEEENSVYTSWNQGVKETLRNFIDRRQEEFPIVGRLLMDFPHKVHLYSLGQSAHGWDIMGLVRGYTGRFNFYRYGSGDTRAVLAKMMNLDSTDHAAMKSFAMDFESSLGPPGRENEFSSKMVTLEVLMKLYFCNLEMGRPTLVGAMKRLRNDNHLRMLVATCGVGQMAVLIEGMLACINRGRRGALVPPDRKIRGAEGADEMPDKTGVGGN